MGPSSSQFARVAEFYDEIMWVVPYPQWVDYVCGLWELYRFRPRTVLDLACGTGNVLLELRRRGYAVDGVDNSAEMLEVARRKVAEGTRLWRQDARSLSLFRTFDACVSLFDSLNYILEPEGLEAAFRSVAAHLNPGGLMVFDVNSIHALETGMFNQSSGESNERVAFDWISAWDPESRLCTIEMEFRVSGEAPGLFCEKHVQRGYTIGEIQEAIRGGGLEPLSVFEAFTHREPNARSDRLHFVARAS